MASSTPAQAAENLRRGIASASCVAAALCFVWLFLDANLPSALALPLLLLLGSAALLHRDHLPSQILVRAALWSNLILGTLLAVSSGHEAQVGWVLAFSTGVGLLALGRAGLDIETEAFTPAAFRGSLVLALVMALADTQSLALFGMLRTEPGSALLILACTGLMSVALIGLYRLRVWGLVLNLVANLSIAGLALGGLLGLPDPIVFALCATALIQLLLPAPLVLAMLRGRPPAARPGLQRVRDAVVPVTVVVLCMVALVGLLAEGRLVHF